MIYLALKMLTGDRLKYIALVAGVSFAALLITQQASIFNGFAKRIGIWIEQRENIDLWVMDPQVRFSEDVKPVNDTSLQLVRGTSGVAWAVPMYKGFLRARLSDGTLQLTRVVGLDDTTLIGAPAEMDQGRLEDLRRDRAVFINTEDASFTLAHKRNPKDPLRIGDRLSLNDHEVQVTGLYRAPREFFWEPVIYTTYSRALEIAPRERKLLSYVLVKLLPGVDVEVVRAAIAERTGLHAFTAEEFKESSRAYIMDRTGILVNFGITIALGFVIGLLVAGQTFYTFVLENLRYFGAIKAMGGSNRTILKMLVAQVLVVGILGYGIGLGAAVVSGAALSKAGLAFYMSWQIPVFGGIAVVGCCLVAGVLGVVRVMRLEPGIVFRS